MPDHVRHLIAESLRVLRPGGTIRITCPDFSLYWSAYKRGDYRFFAYPDITARFPLEQVLLYDLAGMLSECETDQPGLKLRTDYVRQVLATKPMAEALDELCSHIDYERNRQKPNHTSWWTPEKVVHELQSVGFDAYRSGFGQSRAHVMRDTGYDDPLLFLSGYFDKTVPRFSLFVEGEKLS